MPKKLQVDNIPEPDDDLKKILQQMKIKEGVIEPPMETKVSDKQKNRLDNIRVKAVAAKKTNKEKLEFLEKYYIQKEKDEINKQVEKKVYAKRKEREDQQKKKKKLEPEPEPESSEQEEVEEEEESEDEPESSEEESSEEEYVPPPKKKKPGKVTLPVKKKIQQKPPTRKQPQQGYNPYFGIM